MRKVTFLEEANDELKEAFLYYEERALGLGLSFLDEVEEASEQVLANPEAWQLVGNEIRHKLLKRFPYNLLYSVEPDCIRIIAVAHQKRRPGYWRYRF